MVPNFHDLSWQNTESRGRPGSQGCVCIPFRLANVLEGSEQNCDGFSTHDKVDTA